MSLKQEGYSQYIKNTMELTLKNISKTFGQQKEELKSLKDINIKVKKGEFICLLGPSGCGKTTLLNLIAGLDEPDTGGEIEVNGTPVRGPGVDRVVLFQQDALFPWMNVIKNIEFGLKNIKFPREKITPLAEEFLGMVQLKRFRNSYTHTLSGGMKQRVALARALVLKPKILLMDEPFTALDAQTREVLQMLLHKIWIITGQTIVFVTHNIREATFLGSRIILFTSSPGRIKREFNLNLPPPRQINDIRLMSINNTIRNEIREEIETTLKKEIEG